MLQLDTDYFDSSQHSVNETTIVEEMVPSRFLKSQDRNFVLSRNLRPLPANSQKFSAKIDCTPSQTVRESTTCATNRSSLNIKDLSAHKTLRTKLLKEIK